MLARCLSAVALTLCACSPTLDWREVRPEDSGAQALFPCKPVIHTRTLALAGMPTRLSMAACRAGDATFALSFADGGDPVRAAAVLRALSDASVANLGAVSRVVRPMQVKGMTPNPLAQRMHLDGKGPDGTLLAQETGFFSRGTRVYQVTVMAPRLDAEAVETFFDNLSFPG